MSLKMQLKCTIKIVGRNLMCPLFDKKSANPIENMPKKDLSEHSL